MSRRRGGDDGGGRDLQLGEHGLLQEDLLLLDDQLLLQLLNEGNRGLWGQVLLLGDEQLADQVLQLECPAKLIQWFSFFTVFMPATSVQRGIFKYVEYVNKSKQLKRCMSMTT